MPHREDEAGDRKPDKLDRDNDACIVESLHAHFENKDKAGALYFCSENVQDFGHKGEKEIYLDRSIRDGLPQAKYFTDLKSLVDFANKPQPIKEPTPEQEKKDIEKEREEQVRRQQAAELGWILKRHAALDADSQDAGYDPAYYQRRNFPWAALYPVPPRATVVMPQDEELAFGTGKALSSHGPPSNPVPPKGTVVMPPDEELVLAETPQSRTTHGPIANPPPASEPRPEKAEPPKTP